MSCTKISWFAFTVCENLQKSLILKEMVERAKRARPYSTNFLDHHSVPTDVKTGVDVTKYLNFQIIMRYFNWYWKNATFWGHFLTIRVMSHAFASLSLRIPEFSKTKTLFSQVVNCRCSFLTKKTSKKHLWMPGWTYFSCSYRWP